MSSKVKTPDIPESLDEMPPAERQTWAQFLSSIANFRGNIGSLTAPSFIISGTSLTEYSAYWAEHPQLFEQIQQANTAEERALKVLKWFIGTLRGQYSSRNESSKTEKKPLNPILGELFLGTYPSTTSKPITLVSEQVSHHPPITAYHIDTPYNITLTGHNGADLAFKSGSIVVKQTGHAQLILTLPDNTIETYYITLPDLKIQGLLTFTPYVELDRTTYIMSSTGYLATIKYAGAGWISGLKNSFTATLGKGKTVLYKISGQWTGDSTFTSSEHHAQKHVPFWSAKSHPPQHIVVSPIPNQTPWESRRVWKNVAEAIDRNDVEIAGRYKSAIEIGQRKMREDEAREGTSWKQRFFSWEAEDREAGKLRGELANLAGTAALNNVGVVGSWKFTPDEEDRKAIADGRLFDPK